MRKCYATMNMLLKKFVKYSPIVKGNLVKTYCCNLDRAPLWYDSTKTAMKNLKIIYNHSSRSLPNHNSSSGML